MHTFVNDLEGPVGTYLYGRRMYEVMVAWETLPLADQPAFMRNFAQIWRAADKIVYSRTLEAVSSASTRIERDFDPEASDVTLAGSLPHRSEAVRRQMADAFLGAVTWQAICDEFALPAETLIDEAPPKPPQS